MTASLTALTAVILGIAVSVVEVETRDADGERRNIRVIDVWREMLDAIPAQVPGVFNQTVLTILLIASVIGIAYIIVATLRLPR